MPVFAVTTAKGPNWDHARGIREQPFWDEHGAFADGLVKRGVIIIGGPIHSDDAEDIALLAVEATDEAALRSIFDADPWIVHEVFRIKQVQRWTLWLDGRSRLQEGLVAAGPPPCGDPGKSPGGACPPGNEQQRGLAGTAVRSG